METERRVVRPVELVPLGVLVVLALGGCETGRGVEDEHLLGPNRSVLQLRTSFDWVRGADDAAVAEQALDELIVDTVEQELLGKGYVKNTSGDPELRIDYGVVKKERPDETGHGWHEEGTLMLEIINPGSGQRYWRGIAQARLHDDDSPKVRRKRVTEAIRGLLADFPGADREIDRAQGTAIRRDAQ